MNTLEQLRSGALLGAHRLDLSCGLTELPREVFALADTLEVLNLTGNQLRELPHDLGRLHRLKILFASSNAFTHLPESVGECPSLEMVGFKANRIGQVSAAALPAKLRWLIMTDNAIEQLPDALGERHALQKLMLAGNRLRGVPESLAQARRLELLRLSANQLDAIPSWLARLPRLSWLALAGNPVLKASSQRGASQRPLPWLAWSDVQWGERLGEGASGHIHRVQAHGAWAGRPWALKLFKAAVTSDGLPEHEMAAAEAAGQHPALCTPVARLAGHPDGLHGMLLPLLPTGYASLAGPPSFDSCTRDVYPPGFWMAATAARSVAQAMAQALAHLHHQGVLHGDFYAHNILWQPSTGTALLSDFGGASVFDPSAASARAWLATDVRAYGCLLEELLAHSELEPASGVCAETGPWAALAKACLSDDPASRPTMAEVCEQARQA